MDPADRAYVRLAFTPLWESVAAFRAWTESGRHALLLPWITRIKQAVSREVLPPTGRYKFTASRTPSFMGITKYRNWWPEIYRHACKHREIEPNPRLAQLQCEVRKQPGDLKQLAG